MEAECEKCEQKSLQSNHFPIFSSVVKENASTPWKRQSILVLTDYSIDFYSPETLENRDSFIWMKVTGIELKKEEVLVKFGAYSLTIDSFLYAKKIFDYIVYILLNIHTRKELVSMGLIDYLSDIQRPTAVAVLSRILQNQILWGDKPVNQIYNIFKKYLIKQAPIINLSDFREPLRALEYLFDIIPLCSTFKTLIIPNIPGEDIFCILYKHTGRLKRFEDISVEGKAHHFCKFLKKFSQKTNLATTSLEFTNSQFIAKHMVALSEFCDNTKITSLSLHNAFTQETQLSFYTNFFTPNMMMNLSYLNLDYTKELDLENIIPNIPNVVYFSVAYCDLLVEDILDLVKIPNLRTLIADGNMCVRLPPTAIQMPRTLTTLSLANVKWGKRSFINAFKLITLRTDIGINIDFSNADAPSEEFENLFAEINQEINFPIISLKWNGNPVDERLFAFLNKNIRLKQLNMDGVFNDNPQAIKLLCNFIRKTKSISKLSIRGTDDCFMNSSISKVIQSVNESIIEDLDISNNKLNDKGIIALKGLFIKDANLKLLSFDGSSPSNGDLYASLIDVAAQNMHIKISFPINDFNKMLESNMITESIYNSTLALFQFATVDNYGRIRLTISTPSKSPYTHPFHIYVKEDKPIRYLTRFEAEKLMKGRNSDFLSTPNTSSSQVSIGSQIFIKKASEKKAIEEEEISEVKNIGEILELPIPLTPKSANSRIYQNETPLPFKHKNISTSCIVTGDQCLPSGSPKRKRIMKEDRSLVQDYLQCSPKKRKADEVTKACIKNRTRRRVKHQKVDKENTPNDSINMPMTLRTFRDADFENGVEPRQDIKDPLKELRKRRKKSNDNNTHNTHILEEKGTRALKVHCYSKKERELLADEIKSISQNSRGKTLPKRINSPKFYQINEREIKMQRNDAISPRKGDSTFHSDMFKGINPEYLKLSEASGADLTKSYEVHSPKRKKNEHNDQKYKLPKPIFLTSSKNSSASKKEKKPTYEYNEETESLSSVEIHTSKKALESHKTYGSRIRKLICD